MTYDVVIVGAGHAGAYLAYVLGMQRKRVLVLEAGAATHRNREDYMENFFLSTFKAPESPYPPDASRLDPAHTNVPRPTTQALVSAWDQPERSYLTYTKDSMPFASTYERIVGGTGLHWMGTCLRMGESDFALQGRYGKGRDWPLSVDELAPYYARAENFIGVAADVAAQAPTRIFYPPEYEYPMPGIPLSVVDQLVQSRAEGSPLTDEGYAPPNATRVTPTPAGRNSIPYDNRRVCHGNTNCTPICPIRAKFDAAHAMNKALATGYVELRAQTVVDRVQVSSDTARVTGLHYVTYDSIDVPATSGRTGEGVAVGTVYVLAAHAIENAKILLNSPWRNGLTVANRSDQVGRNLMDHPIYLAWGLFPAGMRAYGYRGPVSTAGIETLRDGPFRAHRAAWRIEIGNDGWQWPVTDPYTTGLDYVYGNNFGGLNPERRIEGHTSYVRTLNDVLTRQFRVAFLVEQEADPANRVQLSPVHRDHLGFARPLLTYRLSDYVRAGFAQARVAAGELMRRLEATDHTKTDATSGTAFEYQGQHYNYAGAGHVCGTHLMGRSWTDSVVDADQRSWDHDNLYLVGCGSMPSIGSANPTLTMLAVVGRTADRILASL
ncbi:GMC family oxidoreductase (plasmid) [Burkholderia pyrrocinia]|uniref:GMC family oxidoreductase n=1 Tax=Burkholderia pyrrocinia TaxID=60550 RepID=UPI0038B5CDEC